MSHKLVSLYIGEGEYYTRTDADNVLAEKDEEIYNITYSRDEWAKTCNQKDKEIAELKAACANTNNSAVIESMAAELEKLRPMETALELAEADNKGHLVRIKELEAKIKELEEERRWRNIKNEQPQEGERVLIVDEFFEDISMAMYTEEHSWELNCGATIRTMPYPNWMPLPKTPKEADK